MNELEVQWNKVISGGLEFHFESSTDGRLFITDARLFNRENNRTTPLDGFLEYPVIFSDGKADLHFSISEETLQTNDELRLLVVNKEQHCGWKVTLNLKDESTLVEKIPHAVI